ncbi:MAG: leucine-rich repeat domain-containing protein [Treponema sp.]|nr:leucine-rich repeat domain-containing protein [Treponema sp.]
MNKKVIIITIMLLCLFLSTCGNSQTGTSAGHNTSASGNNQAQTNQPSIASLAQRKTSAPDDFGYRRNSTNDGVNISYNTGDATDIVIPAVIDGLPVKSWSVSIFKGDKNITSISLPDSIESIPEAAFSDCTSLVSVKLPANLKVIAASTFQGCTALKSISLPNGLTAINDGAFNGCKALADVTFPSDINTMSDSLKIGNRVFFGCSGLKNITLSNNVTAIGISAFQNCENLSKVTLSEKLTTLGQGAFFRCYELKDLNVPDALTNFPRGNYSDGTFGDLNYYTYYYGTTKNISYAFSWCNKLPLAVRDKLNAQGYPGEGY